VSCRILLRPAAERDIDAQAEYIATSSGDAAGLRFYRSAEQTLKLLARRPANRQTYPLSQPAARGNPDVCHERVSQASDLRPHLRG